jgi:molecular chaperone HtpG
MTNSNDYRFQVNLEGIISLLSNHLYSNPGVFLRELMQNAVDAISARKEIDLFHEGEVVVEVFDSNKVPKTLIFEDNGIGLTEDEIHKFLAVIGQSSKNGEIGIDTSSFIGKFGIGILACFIVSEEITFITHSINSSDSFEWKGKPDGTYSIRKLDNNVSVGTKVYIQSKVDFEEYFTLDSLKNNLYTYGALLEYPIHLLSNNEKILINEKFVPWHNNADIARYSKDSIMEFGRKVFNENFIDYIPIHSEIGDVTGIAYIIPYSVNLAAKKVNKIYLKNMFITQNADNILPDWAFFVKCIINANNIEPTASREGFYEDSVLETVKENIGTNIKSYLKNLSKSDSQTLERVIDTHSLSIKALAVEDTEILELFMDWIPFETSMGYITFGDIKKRKEPIKYAATVDEFRQISKVAAAQAICLINGGYIYNKSLLENYSALHPEVNIERIEPTDITTCFEELSFTERDAVYDFIRTADIVLQPFMCKADIKKFNPIDVQALYSINESASMIKSIERSKDESDNIFAGLMDNISSYATDSVYSNLCFNFDNELIIKLINSKDKNLQKFSIEMIYVQSLLMGQYPLSKKEMKLMNNSTCQLIDWAINK